MDEKAKDTAEPLPIRSYKVLRGLRRVVRVDDGPNNRRCLLLEFLQNRVAQPPVNVQEESSSQPQAVKRENLATFPDDLLYHTFILLPSESLASLQFVCKKWFTLINCSAFIRCHAQQSNTVLICQKLTLLEPGNHPVQPEANFKSYFHFLHLNNGDDHFIESDTIELADIKASYDGLIIATMKKNKALMLMNPVTRKHTTLPSGTAGDPIGESYGMAICDEGKTYKVVHLFRGRGRQVGCEILNIRTKSWQTIEGPPEILHEIVRGSKPVSVSGSLYWMPRRHFSDYIVSMNMQDLKFITKKLPVPGTKRRLIEIGGSLGFANEHAEGSDATEVWILMNDGETWTKRYSIDLHGHIGRPFPICSTRNGRDIVLEDLFSQLYVYDSDSDEVKLIHSRYNDGEGCYGRIEKQYIPHRSTLASWDT